MESNSSHSEAKINGVKKLFSKEETERFWKKEFVSSMKDIEPRFTVDERNRSILTALYKWVWCMADSELDPMKGLLLHGPLGVGKSVLLRGLQLYEGKMNRYAFGFNNDRLGFKFTSAAEISLRYSEKGIEGISKYTDRESMSNLAIDEVGREPIDSKHFGTGINVIQTILQLRYEHRNHYLTHITTNLNPASEAFSDLYGEYITDRVKEMFNVIHIKGSSRR